MNWLEGLIYGLISGLAEFMPVSSQAHQRIMLHMFGLDAADPVRDLAVHLALLYALYTGCRNIIDPIRRDRRAQLQRRRGHRQSGLNILNLRFIKNAAAPMLIGMLLIPFVFKADNNLLTVSICLLVNGLLLFFSERLIHGNKDVRSMTVFDSTLIGLAGALSGFCGISRFGATASVAVSRGAERQQALNWAFLLGIPALVLLSGMDLFTAIFGGVEIHFWRNFFTYILSAAGAYIGGYLSILLVKLLCVNIGFYGFAYYSWGASLFSFILYLIVV